MFAIPLLACETACRPVHGLSCSARLWVCAGALLASFSGAAQVNAQSATVVSSGRIEGASPTMSIGVAAAGTVSEVSVRAGSRVRSGQILIKLDCSPVEADVRAEEAQLSAAQAVFERTRNGSRPDEIKVGEAVVGYSEARADEAQKALVRAKELQEGVTVSTARVLEVERDARIAAAQLQEARARLSLLRAGSREEDIRQAQALRDAAVAVLDATRARLNQCSVHSSVDGTVLDVLVNPGQYVSMAVPQTLLHMIPDGPLAVEAEVEVRDLTHICTTQDATITADAFPGSSLRAQVVSISPVVAQRSNPTTADRDKEIVPVILNLDRGAIAPPIGSAVTVRFDPCPSKT
jgi:HlyD family secretion protein